MIQKLMRYEMNSLISETIAVLNNFRISRKKESIVFGNALFLG